MTLYLIRYIDAGEQPNGSGCWLDPLEGFYPAEDYHQDYLIRNPDQPYIVFNDLPKIASLKKLLADDYRNQPVRFAPERSGTLR
jgi:hypothetical protein